MNVSANAQDLSFEAFRDYLRVLAEVELNRKLRRRLDPSDLVQETMLKAYKASEAEGDRVRKQSEAQRAAWLRTILANTLADAARDHRRDKRDIRRDRSLEQALEESSSRLDALLVSAESSPSQKASREELVLRLAGAFASLPEDQRRALLLQRFEGLSIADVAERMKRTRTSVAGLLRRALKRLREELKQEAS